MSLRRNVIYNYHFVLNLLLTLAVSASEMTYIVSSWALNSTHYYDRVQKIGLYFTKLST